MVKPDQVERIVHGLIREHLARTGKKDILKHFDLDVPRKEDSLTKTKLIVSAFGSAGKKLYKQNKESKKPLTSVLDIMSNHYYKVSSKKSRSKKKSSTTSTATRKKPTKTTTAFSVNETNDNKTTINTTDNNNSNSNKKINQDTFFGFDVIEDSKLETTNITTTVKENKPAQVGSLFTKQPSSSSSSFQKSSAIPPPLPNAANGRSASSNLIMEDIDVEDEMYDFT